VFGSNLLAVGAAAIEAIEYVDPILENMMPFFDINTTNKFKLKIIEGSLEVKLPTIWTDEKQSREEAERRGRLEERRVEE
jgi:hypothetical protein